MHAHTPQRHWIAAAALAMASDGTGSLAGTPSRPGWRRPTARAKTAARPAASHQPPGRPELRAGVAAEAALARRTRSS